MILAFFSFFFSSRRRHTRCSRDWSSDVCSSDLLEASRAEMVSQQEELDANDIESRAAMVSPGGAAKLSAAANGAVLRSQAYDQRLLARLMRLEALKIARENSIGKEQEKIREGQVNAVSARVGGMKLSYGLGYSRGQ